MTEKIRIAIAGYGNLGRGTEMAVAKSADMTLVGVFTRRNPEDLKLLTALVVAAFLAIPYLKSKYFSTKGRVKHAQGR